MRHGKYETTKRKIPPAAWILSLLAVLGMFFGGAAAYLSTSTGPVTNSFSAAQAVNPTIAGNYSVNIGNPGYAVYVRAMVIINWKDASGHILAAAPVADTDYTIEMNSVDWIQIGQFWYYRKPISSGSTDALVKSVASKTDKTGYTLAVDMAVQTIQAVGTTDLDHIDAVKDAWGIDASAITDASE